MIRCWLNDPQPEFLPKASRKKKEQQHARHIPRTKQHANGSSDRAPCRAHKHRST
jgi:hypothetical protein